MPYSKIMGFSYQKGKIRYSTLSNIASNLTYLNHGSIKYDVELDLSDLVERWRLDFNELFKAQKPDLVSSIEIWESKSRNSSRYQILPLGILSQCCKSNNIPIKVFTPQAFIKGGPFGLPAGAKPIHAVDAKFQAHPPLWDEMQRKSVLVAWRAALE
ncbi:hypothetical protein [Mesorhizobium sp. LSJC269B00]|uniref:hypothetical protein n=1 Tax=unclassified Mesorhizobium TaxID=325217 RepID=UPI0012EB2DBA|nr:hypothetical protein [Mesorhizobium sp. LSJC269B00]